jgi:hypothetical protein
MIHELQNNTEMSSDKKVIEPKIYSTIISKRKQQTPLANPYETEWSCHLPSLNIDVIKIISMF